MCDSDVCIIIYLKNLLSITEQLHTQFNSAEVAEKKCKWTDHHAWWTFYQFHLQMLTIQSGKAREGSDNVCHSVFDLIFITTIVPCTVQPKPFFADSTQTHFRAQSNEFLVKLTQQIQTSKVNCSPQDKTLPDVWNINTTESLSLQE